MKAIWDNEHASHWKRIWWHAGTMIKGTYTVKFNKKNKKQKKKKHSANLIQNIKAQIHNFLHVAARSSCDRKFKLVLICQQNLTPLYAYIWNMWPYKHLFQQTVLNRLYLHHQPGQLRFQHTKQPPSVPATRLVTQSGAGPITQCSHISPLGWAWTDHMGDLPPGAHLSMPHVRSGPALLNLLYSSLAICIIFGFFMLSGYSYG